MRISSAIQPATRSRPHCNLREISPQTGTSKSIGMSIGVRQVPSWMDCSAKPAASPEASSLKLQFPGTAGTAARFATAKVPSGAGSVAATGHVVAPALSCDGSGPILFEEAPEAIPDNDTNRCYPAPRTAEVSRRPQGAAGPRAKRFRLPAPRRTRSDRPRGDRPCRPASRRVSRTRSGFGRVVSLSSEPAPQNSQRRARSRQRSPARFNAAPRNCRDSVARARS